MDDLFAHLFLDQAAGSSAAPDQQAPLPRQLVPGVWHLPRRLLGSGGESCAPTGWPAALASLLEAAPWRHWATPGGSRMSVLSSNCGALGWVSDQRGYRYQATDPQTGEPWPAMPASWRALASRMAAEVGFHHFDPDACLINGYQPGARMGLHQDRDEADFGQPIVSWSLGMGAVFLFGGLRRRDPTRRVALEHGDGVVWGGPARLRFHGIAPIKGSAHGELGFWRVNLTFRRAAPVRANRR